MAATSHDVAVRAGVSQPTVSRALRDDPRVAEATKDKVRRAVDELGYVPSDVGRSLATRSTRQIAMVADLRNALYPSLVEPLHDAVRGLGLRRRRRRGLRAGVRHPRGEERQGRGGQRGGTEERSPHRMLGWG